MDILFFMSRLPTIYGLVFRSELSVLWFCFCLLQGLAKLVGTGGALHSASDTLQSGAHILGIHAYHELGESFGIAVTATIDTASRHNTFLETHFDVFATCAMSLIEEQFLSVFTNNLVLLKFHYSADSSGFILV